MGRWHPSGQKRTKVPSVNRAESLAVGLLVTGVSLLLVAISTFGKWDSFSWGIRAGAVHGGVPPQSGLRIAAALILAAALVVLAAALVKVIPVRVAFSASLVGGLGVIGVCAAGLVKASDWAARLGINRTLGRQGVHAGHSAFPVVGLVGGILLVLGSLSVIWSARPPASEEEISAAVL